MRNVILDIWGIFCLRWCACVCVVLDETVRCVSNLKVWSKMSANHGHGGPGLAGRPQEWQRKPSFLLCVRALSFYLLWQRRRCGSTWLPLGFQGLSFDLFFRNISQWKETDRGTPWSHQPQLSFILKLLVRNCLLNSVLFLHWPSTLKTFWKKALISSMNG